MQIIVNSETHVDLIFKINHCKGRELIRQNKIIN